MGRIDREAKAPGPRHAKRQQSQYRHARREDVGAKVSYEYANRASRSTIPPRRLEALLTSALDAVESEGLRDSEGNPHALLSFVVSAVATGTDSRRLHYERQADGLEFRRG
jgi:hypothetical protein